MNGQEFTIYRAKNSKKLALRKEAEKFNYFGSFWIVDTQKLKIEFPDINDVYIYELKERYMPAIIISENPIDMPFYDFAIFTSISGSRIFLNIEKCSCVCSNMLENGIYRLLSVFEEGENNIRRIFNLDLRIAERFMEFCGVCNLNYIREIKNRIKR